MASKNRSNDRLKFSFQRLMILYMVLLIVVMGSITAILMANNVKQYFINRKQAEILARNCVSETVERYRATTNEYGEYLSSDVDFLSNLEQYFQLDTPTYAQYTIDQSIKTGKYFSWERETTSYLIKHPEIARLELRLTNMDATFVATQKNRSGYVINNRTLPTKNSFTCALINPQTLGVVGTIELEFKTQDLLRQLGQINSQAHMQIVVLNDEGRMLLHYDDPMVTKKERQEVKRAISDDKFNLLKGYSIQTDYLSGNYQMSILFSNSGSERVLFGRLVPIALLGLLVLIFLLVMLQVTFKTYQRQLLAILDTMKKVSHGDLKARINQSEKYTDLNELVIGINYMLDEIDRYVYTIYQLQIEQQDAHMKALRSQINPHFMANTLEYIRMAALDAGQYELAKVIYSFSALLQNNIDQAQVTSFGSELKFVDKYIYLYQTRYPDRLAYQIKIDDDLKGIELPKFTLQPLVENYFVHGVDFSRSDNVISIKAYRKDEYVYIEIINNGRPLTQEQLATLNVRMLDKLSGEKRKSIGLQNVYARAQNYFGPSFNMRLQGNIYGGVTVVLRFKPKED